MHIKTMMDEPEESPCFEPKEPCEVCGELVKETFIKLRYRKVSFVCKGCLK